MLRSYELQAKTWRLRKMQTAKRNALAYCKQTNYRGLGRLLAESLTYELQQLAAELKRRKD